jgi:hypothetical protein
MRARLAALLCVVGLACCLAASGQSYPSVPSSVFSLSGTQLGATSPTASYRAYQNPGDTFRVVCPEPCPVDPQTIYAFYAGFKQAKGELISLMGVDSATSQQPFDLHIANDTWCGNYANQTGDAGTYPASSGAGGTFGCFWFANRTNYFEPFEPQYVSALPYHLLTVHEYTHTIFYGRHFFSYEDFAKAMSFAVSGIGGAPPITDPCNPTLDDVSQGKLLWTLCRVNGLAYSNLPAALQPLAALSQAGQGAIPLRPQITSVFQFRRILDSVLGGSTTDAFLAAKIPPPDVADDGSLSPAGGRLETISGWISLAVPSGAVASTTAFHVEGLYSAPGFPNLDFQNIFSFTPSISLAKPAVLTIKYDPSLLLYGSSPPIAESSLRLYQLTGSSWQAVPGARLDAADQTVVATVSALGTFGLFGTTAASAEPARAIPVVGSVQGGAGSNFKTSFQIHNPSTGLASGKLIFHPQGASGKASDPSLSYSLSSWQTASYADLLTAFGASGLGSLDVVPDHGEAPQFSVRVFNDAGPAGTSGFTEEPVKSAAALQPGDHAILLTPPNLATARLNIGVRTLSSGASMTVRVRSASGSLTATFSKSYPADFFSQVGVSSFVPPATPLSGNDSIELQIDAGSAIVYGASADNTTNDPSLAYARNLAFEGGIAGDILYLPAVGSLQGDQGSFFRTTLQLYNSSSSPAAGRLVFHPAGKAGSDSDPSLAYSLAPNQTRSYDDVLAAMGQSGLGSLDIVSTSGPPPLAWARVFNDAGSKGTYGFTEEALRSWQMLQAGDYATLIVPADLTRERLNVGIRTRAGTAAVITVRVNNAAGFTVLGPFAKTYPANDFEQVSASQFLNGFALSGGEAIQIYMEGGSAILYGAAADNTTSDPSLALSRRLPSF